MLVALLTLLLAAPTAPAPPALGADSVVMLVMVDRFANGSADLADVVTGHPRRFNGGDLEGVRQRLPWLQALGVSHVWLTPLHNQIDGLVGDGASATAGSHGYWPERFAAVDPHFGDVAQLQRLVREAGDLGMGIIIDVVVNHFGYGASDPAQLVRTPCGDTDETRCLFGLPDLRTEDPRVRQIVVDNTVWWLKQAPFVGVRLDAFKHIDRETARAITAAIHAQNKRAVVIAERWGAAPGDADVVDDVRSGAANAAFDFGFFGLARDCVLGRMRPRACAHHLETRAPALASGPSMFTFLDNHDVETWAHAAGANAPLGAALLLTTPGTPVLSWGIEVGRVGGAVDPDNRTMIDWTHVDDTEPRQLRHWWQSLTTLRRRSKALQAGDFRIIAADDAAGTLTYSRALDDERVIVHVSTTSAAAPTRVAAPHESIASVARWPAGEAAVLVDDVLTISSAGPSATVVVLKRARVSP
jgi:glycosidase